MKRARRWWAVIAFSAVVLAARPAAAETLRALVPDGDNLQYLAFWVASGKGYFKDEGVDLTLEVPPTPREAVDAIRKSVPDVAVLPPPIALELAAAGVPMVLVANLLANDPINLVVRADVAKERALSADLPMEERLRRMKGLRVGVAPGPPPRLRALFHAHGLDADKDVAIVLVPGKMQNAAFGEKRVDALYAHTPYLETALLDQGAVLLVHQSGGEVPVLSHLQIHGLAVSRSLRDTAPATVEGLVRAITRAERLVHDDEGGAVDAVLAQFPSMQREKVATLVRLYRPAIPTTSAVTVEGLRGALTLFPASKEAPAVSDAALAAFVDGSFALKVASAEASGTQNGAKARGRPSTLVAAGGFVAVLGAIGAALRFRRRKDARSVTAATGAPPSDAS